MQAGQTFDLLLDYEAAFQLRRQSGEMRITNSIYEGGGGYIQREKWSGSKVEAEIFQCHLGYLGQEVNMLSLS